ncbi:MAG TPA: AraC family transcriptional regulator [Chthonomonadaceae bacterium]|nr:AraC family transcriptional regulator [Chthonomonadaceae bacterium]
MEDLANLAIEGLALEMFVLVSRRATYLEEQLRPRWLTQARDYLHAEFTAKHTLPQIAAAVGVHPVHLARVFRQHYHCTVVDYVRQLRVAFACRQLAQSDIPLAVIALDAGFADQSQFTRTFKRMMGMTPGEYRTEIRKC